MGVDHLPMSCFPPVAVRNTMLDGDPLAGELELSTLDAHFVGDIPNGADELIRKFYLPVRGYFRDLLE